MAAPMHRQQLMRAHAPGVQRRCHRRAAVRCVAAAGAPLGPQALKEWAVAGAALGAGEQTILLRKGGIKEPRFKPEARAFFIFPTAFHSEQQLLKPGVAERYAAAMALDPKGMKEIPLAQYAEVTGCWTTEDERVLEVLDPLHVWAGAFLETRLKWRQQQPITLLELRAYRIDPPLRLPAREDLFGCFSWVGLPGVASGDVVDALARKVPALSDEAFAERQALLRSRLGEIGAVPLQL